VKQMGGNTFICSTPDSNNLARPILYGAYHPMSVCPMGVPRLARPAVLRTQCKTSLSRTTL